MARRPNTGILFPTAPTVKKRKGPKYPDYYGEILIDPNDLHKVLAMEGLVKIQAWRHPREGFAEPFIKINVSFWKPGDLTRAQIEAGKSADDEEWIVPE